MKTIQIRLPDQDYSQAQSVLDDIGLDMPTALRLFLRKVVHSRAIPFPLEASTAILEIIPVDAPTQTKMDAVGAAWSKIKADHTID